MSVTAVTAISLHTQDLAQPQQGWRQDILALQKALSSGNLNSVQHALNNFQQDLQSVRPQQNGIRASAEVNPQKAIRSDLQALQSALDSGDLAMAEEAFARIQQDSEQMVTQKPDSMNTQTARPASALPEDSFNSQQSKGATDAGQVNQSKGNSIDVIA